MINREKRDKEAFLRERTLDSIKENPHLELGDIVYVAEEQSFYSIVDSSSSADNKTILLNDLFAVLQEDPKRYTKTETDSKFTALDNKLVDGLDKKSDKGHKHGNAEITDIDASKIVSGIIDIERLPTGALERCVIVANDVARFALTKSQVQTGDTVKVTATNKMYFVIDDTKLNVEAGYTVYTAVSDWSSIINKPTSLKNPNALTIKVNGTNNVVYDGSSVKEINLTPELINAYSKNIKGTITNLEQLDAATETGVYLVANYAINAMYGYGLLYVNNCSGKINQLYVSHRSGICYRQVWDTNISSGTWITTLNNSNLSSEIPKVAGTAVIGNSTKLAREDHVHPVQTTVSGNAGTATTLQNARTIGISGGATGTATSFNGSTNITIPVTALDVSKATAGILTVARGGTGNTTNTSASCTGNSATATKLQTSRNIGNAPFDGTANLTLAQIGAAEAGHTHGYMPISGGTFSGNVVGQAAYSISGFGKVYNAVWNDYAEFFERGEETEPGDIIALDVSSDEERYIKADCKHYDIVGVHSNSFAHLIGGEEPPEGEDYFEHNIKKFIPIGLAGRVMCKVIGPVKKGDYIGVSKIPGVGIANESMTINRIGIIEASVVGMALENKETDEIGLVKILID